MNYIFLEKAYLSTVFEIFKEYYRDLNNFNSKNDHIAKCPLLKKVNEHSI